MNLAADSKRYLFLMVFFVFLLFGSEIFAAACVYPSSWNGVNCTIDIDYTDPCSGGQCSGLNTCERVIGNNTAIPDDCSAATGWSSSGCSCSGLPSYTCSGISIQIGSGLTCSDQGTNACQICSKATDAAGNVGYGVAKFLYIDYTKPTAQVISPAAGSCQKQPSFNSTFRYSDAGGSKLNTCEYKVVSSGVLTLDWTSAGSCSGADSQDLTKNITVGSTGNCRHEGTNTCTIYVRARDVAGNLSDEGSRSFSIDWSNPSQTTWNPISRDWANTDVSVTVRYDDSGCGMTSTQYCWTTGASCTPGTLFTNGGTITQSSNGSWNLCIMATDVAGNSVTDCKGLYKVDKELPITTISPNGASWTKNDVNFTLSCTDGYSGCNLRQYKVIDSGLTCDTTGLTTGSSGTVTCSAGSACQKKVCFRSTDIAGNQENIKTSNIFQIDKKNPSRTTWNPLNRSCSNADASVTVLYGDTDSGISATQYCWTTGVSCVPATSFTNGGAITQSSTGSWTLCVTATDVAGNSVTECQSTYTVDKDVPNQPTFNPTLRNWLNTDVSVAATYTDNLCGITYTRHCWTAAASCDPGTTDASTFTNGGSITQTVSGLWTLCTRAKDGAGNWAGIYCSGQGVYKIDKNPPNAPTRNPDLRDWDITDISVTVTYTDDLSGISATNYCWTTSASCSPVTSFTNGGAITQTQAGQWTLCTNATDVAGNSRGPDCSAQGAYKKNAKPTCTGLSAAPTSGYNPLAVIFTGSGNDPDGTIANYQWDFNGDGAWDATTTLNTIGYVYGSVGTYCAKLRVQDNRGVWSDVPGSCPTTCAVTIIVSGDTTSPVTTVQCNGAACSSGWYVADVSVALSCSDAQSGCDKTYYCIDQTNACNPATQYAGAFNITTEATNYVRFYSKDYAGNSETPVKSQPVKIDKTAPTITDFKINGYSKDTTVYASSAVTITWQATDTGGSGIQKYELWRKPDGGSWEKIVDPATSGLTNTPPSAGTWWYGLHALDNASNCIDEKGTHCGGVASDTLDPRTIVGPIKVVYSNISPLVDSDNYGTWWKANITPITITASTNGGSSIIETRYNWDSNSMDAGCTSGGIIYSASITLSTEGTHILYMCTRNQVGLTGTQNRTYHLDKTLPSASANNASSAWFTSRTTTLSASDTGGSGLNQARYNWDTNPMSADCTSGGTVFTDGTVLTVSQGSHRLYLCARDGAGNTKTWDSGADQYRVDATAPTLDTFTVNGISYPTVIYTNTAVTIAWTASDTGGSGIQKYEVWRAPDSGGSPGDWGTGPIVDNATSPITNNPGAGTWWYGLHIKDNASNCIDEKGAHCGGVTSDGLDPRTIRGPIKVIYSAITPSVDSNNSGLPWKTSDISITITASTNGGTSIVETRYIWDNPTALNVACTSGGTVYSASITLSTEGTHILYMCTRNQVGLTGTQNRTYYLDKTLPSTNFVSPTPSDDSWQKDDFPAKVMDSDTGGSGLKGGDGCGYLVSDLTRGVTVKSGSRICGEYTFDVPAGTGSLECQEDRTPPIGQSTCHVETTAYDNAGNSKTVSRNFKVDYTPPLVGATVPLTAIQGVATTFSAAVSDSVSQILGCWFYVEGASTASVVNYSSIPCTSCTASTTYTFNEIRNYNNVFFMCMDAAQNYTSGNPVTVQVIAPPTLFVDLSANPSVGVTSLYNVDLTATTSGTMTGTINYKFYCTSTGPLTLETGATNINPYTAVDLCNYPSIGNYTAKVIVDRGTGSIQATTSISVVSNQPPVCQISVSDRTTTSTAISIGVGNSSDPEGALSGVKFCSDKNPANPNGQCDESWTKEYLWNTSENPPWTDAASKTMRWSFSQTGTYEVWAQVKDNVNQTASCYDTILVTECLPGDIKLCTSSYGCSHTLTCQANGTWPACPADECSLGSTQNCAGGTQICSASCSWGPCSPSGSCTPPAPSCLTCYHAVCSGSTWSCQPDDVGVDCGDCRRCDGTGGCNSVCSGDKSSCECISDTCRDCSDYYDFTGPTYGYQGVCHCGSLEFPVWACSSGACSCVCWNPSQPPPPPPYVPPPSPPLPPSPPPGECVRNYPDVYLSPTSQAGTAGQQLPYTVWVKNNDTNCSDSIFSLSKSCPTGWTCSLNLSSLTVSPGYSKSTTLKVTSPLSAIKDYYPVSATASSTYFIIEAGAIYQVANNPPTASIGCDNSQCGSGSSCSTQWIAYTSGASPDPCIFKLKNNSTDPDSTDPDETNDIKNSIWAINGTTNEGAPVDFESACISDPCCDFTLSLEAGNYTAVLTVEDKAGATDNSSPKSFIIRQDVIADFDCSLNSEGPWQECDILKASEGEIVYFRDKSTYSDGGSPIISRSWIFEDGTPAVSMLQYPYSSFQKADQGSGRATLTVTDSAGRSDTTTYQVWITIPLPKWQETPPL